MPQIRSSTGPSSWAVAPTRKKYLQADTRLRCWMLPEPRACQDLRTALIQPALSPDPSQSFVAIACSFRTFPRVRLQWRNALWASSPHPLCHLRWQRVAIADCPQFGLFGKKLLRHGPEAAQPENPKSTPKSMFLADRVAGLPRARRPSRPPGASAPQSPEGGWCPE